VPLDRIHFPTQRRSVSFPYQFGVRQVEVPATVQLLHQVLIHRRRRFDDESRRDSAGRVRPAQSAVSSESSGELVRQAHVLADVVLQACNAVVADYEPELERAKARPRGTCQSR